MTSCTRTAGRERLNLGMLCEVRVHDRSPFVVDGIVEVGVIVVVGVVIPGPIVELKVDSVPAKKCASFIGGDSEREVGEERHLTDYVDGIFGQNRLKEMEEGVEVVSRFMSQNATSMDLTQSTMEQTVSLRS